MAGVPRIVYRARVERARYLASHGWTRRQIAQDLGMTFDGVHSLCNKNRIFTKRIRTVKAHPLVEQLIGIANEQQAPLSTIANRAGVHRATMSNWRLRAVPRLDMFVAAANSLGYELVLQERRE